ncbi:MAG TPA: TonB-dependent receptor [Planctomycetota bacterium]|nr:TonB-dependent receptor [Planctomycetota bacterium]
MAFKTNRLRQQLLLVLLTAFPICCLPSALCGEATPPDVATEKKSEPQPNVKKAAADQSIFTLPIEQLMNIQVTSVSKAPSKVSESPTAIHVITQEDIRRSGANSIPEALRMAPGLSVARVTGNQWAISARGFNFVFANKLLVMIDGRSVYTPLFSGTLWDVQDTMMEDIDRIEVIRGPGATLWGSNAVNGVINIITKNANETQGGLAVAGAGTEERALGAVRYGGKPAKNVAIRGFVKYFENDEQALPGGKDASDDWRMGRGGFRADWKASKDDTVTFHGEAYRGRVGETLTVPSLTPPFDRELTGDGKVSGASFHSRWSHQFSEQSEMQLGLYYDRTDRTKIGIAEDHRDTVDLDFQHHFHWQRNNIVYGMGYRVSHDNTESGAVSFDPQSRTVHLLSAFIQDEITVLKDRLHVTFGTKLEHNEITGFEIQPSARVLFTPDRRNTLWASASRAVRTPARVDYDARVDIQALPPGTLGPGTPAALISAFSDDDFQSETLMAYELGFRTRPHPRISLDIAGFFNDYDNIRSVEPGGTSLETTPAPAHLLIRNDFGNKRSGSAYGGEAVVTAQLQKWWRIQGTYSFLRVDMQQGSSLDPGANAAERTDPRNQVGVRSMMDLPKKVELDLWLRYVDSLSGLNVPSYFVGDVRVGWRPVQRLDVSLVGRNLFDTQHPEFSTSFIRTQPTEVQRSVFLKFTLKF